MCVAAISSERLGVSNVTFLPFQAKEKIGESFAAADVFVVSLQSGLAGCIVPSKLYGILAAGRPYVAAVEDTCEVAAITRTYACGLVVEPGNGRDIDPGPLREEPQNFRILEVGSVNEGLAKLNIS